MLLEERQQLLEGVGEGIVADVVKQGGGEKDANVFVFQLERRVRAEQANEKLLGEMVDAERMLESGVPGARIDEVDETELSDVAKSLEVLGVNEGKQWFGQVDIPPHRVANRLAFLFEKRVVHGAQSTGGVRPCQGLAGSR